MKTSETKPLRAVPFQSLVRDLPRPHYAKCPDCDSYHGQGSMVPHLQWQHGYDPEAAKYRTGQIFRHEFEEWQKVVFGITNVKVLAQPGETSTAPENDE